jgi:hypothetical protein
MTDSVFRGNFLISGVKSGFLYLPFDFLCGKINIQCKADEFSDKENSLD